MMRPMKILLVEDEAFIALSLRLQLEHTGYVVSSIVATGEAAILRAAEQQPDVILMDIRLAGDIDGIEAAQQIRAHSAVPIVFMTGYEEAALKERAEAAGPSGYFIKPVSMHELVPVINSLELAE